MQAPGRRPRKGARRPGRAGSALRERGHGGGDHPVPSRTRQLSPPSPRVLQRQAAGGQDAALAQGASALRGSAGGRLRAAFLFPAGPARTAAIRPAAPRRAPPPACPFAGLFCFLGPEPMRRCANRERSRVCCVLSFSLPCFVLVCAFSYASNPILASIPSCRNPGFGWPNIHFKHHAASRQAPCGISLFDWSWGNVSQAAILRCDFDLPGAIHDA